MSIVELNFPQVVSGETSHYGGSQDWFEREFHRQAGCASICGINLAAYYAANFPSLAALYPGDTTRFSQEDFLEAMNAMCGYIPPTPALGVPYMCRFIDCFGAYASERGVRLRPNLRKSFPSWMDGFAFVRQAIDSGNPLALLILRHSDAEFWPDTWHWVAISGYVDSPTEPKVIYSNFGKRELHSADRLFGKGEDNILSVVYFERED